MYARPCSYRKQEPLIRWCVFFVPTLILNTGGVRFERFSNIFEGASVQGTMCTPLLCCRKKCCYPPATPVTFVSLLPVTCIHPWFSSSKRGRLNVTCTRVSMTVPITTFHLPDNIFRVLPSTPNGKSSNVPGLFSY